MVRWKQFLSPTDTGASPIHPLGVNEFVYNVLVPEASIRLIMQDKGWQGEQQAYCPSWEAAWEDASQVRTSSVLFGSSRWRTDDPECLAILEQIREEDEKMRDLIERTRRPVEL